jgi:hypothetical protein
MYLMIEAMFHDFWGASSEVGLLVVTTYKVASRNTPM